MANFFGRIFKSKPQRGTSPPPPALGKSSGRMDLLSDENGRRSPATITSGGFVTRDSAPEATPQSLESQASQQTQQSQQSNQSQQSEFARSAHEAARQGLREPAREIDENTALTSLTDAEIVRLMEGMEGDMLSKPLITGPVPILAIKKEYLRGSREVLRKLEWLEENGWDQVWRARGDGDCFYRSFTLAYLLRILYAPNPAAEAAQALTNVHATLPSMERSGFQSDLLDEFLEPFLSTIAAFVDPPAGQEPTEYSLLQVLQNAEKSNCIVVALRLITGAYIRTHPDDFAPFLFSPATFEPVTPDVFCAQEVEPCGREADNAQIMALAAALKTPVRVAYLDRSEAGAGVINWVEFEDAVEENRPLTLLYRPGHFDVVAKDKLQAALVSAQNEEQAAAVRADAAAIFSPSGPTAGPSGTSGTTTESAPHPAPGTTPSTTTAPKSNATTPITPKTTEFLQPGGSRSADTAAPTATSSAPPPAPGARPVPPATAEPTPAPGPTPAAASGPPPPGPTPAPAPAPTPAAAGPTAEAAPGPTAAPTAPTTAAPTATAPPTATEPAPSAAAAPAAAPTPAPTATASTSDPTPTPTPTQLRVSESDEERKTPGSP